MVASVVTDGEDAKPITTLQIVNAMHLRVCVSNRNQTNKKDREKKSIQPFSEHK